MPKSESIDESRALAITEEHLAYDRSKALAEEVVLAAVQQGLDAVILNPVGIIGPFDFEPSPMGELLLQLAHREMPGLVKAGFFWVDVRDVATASIAAEQRGRTGERYILHGEYGLVTSLAKQVQDVTGRRPPLFTAPLWLARLVAPGAEAWSRITGNRPLFTRESIQILACHQRIETQKAVQELGFHARPLSETVNDTLQWFKEAGHLRI